MPGFGGTSISSFTTSASMSACSLRRRTISLMKGFLLEWVSVFITTLEFFGKRFQMSFPQKRAYHNLYLVLIPAKAGIPDLIRYGFRVKHGMTIRCVSSRHRKISRLTEVG